MTSLISRAFSTIIISGAVALVVLLLSVVVKILNNLVLAVAQGWGNYTLNKRAAESQIIQQVTHIPPDEHGLLGAIVRADGALVNLDEQVILLIDEQIAKQIIPVNEQLLGMRRMLAALPDHVAQPMVDKIINDIPVVINPLPDRLPLSTLITEPPSIDHVPLGQWVSPSGLMTVTAPLHQLVHLMVAGETGSGKSSAIQSWAYYLWATKQVDLGLIDLGRVTFTRFRDAGLMWPIGTTPGAAVALLREFVKEMMRRLALMEQHKGAENITQYNQIPGAEQLKPIVVFVDELPDLMDVAGAEAEIGQIVRTGRKAGTWLWFAGTNFHASTFPTRYRSNVLYKACMHSDEMTGKVIVNTRDVVSLAAQGRALVQLPFVLATKQGLPTTKGPLEFQLPMIPDNDPLWDRLDCNLPARHRIVEVQVDDGYKNRTQAVAAQIVQTWKDLPEEERSVTAIARVVWPGKIKGSAGGSYYHQVVDALAGAGLTKS